MGLLEDLSNESNFPKPARASCSVCKLISTLTGQEGKALAKRLEDKNTSHTALSRVLKNNGIEISDSVMGRHRRGVCSGTRR